MASTSSSSSGSGCQYDVFLNFRGVDTRKIFVGHLHKALTQKLLNAFIDAENLRKGNHLSVLLKAIIDSKISIVVFSKNYASSTWCLKELFQIMKCKKEQEQIVVPVFYEVDPSNVRKQEGSFAQAFSEHESNKDLQLQEVQNWKSALKEAAGIVGWDSTKYEDDDAKLIDAIVDHVFKEWLRISSSKNNHLVGLDFRVQKMRQRLRLKMYPRVLRVGIWGMGGIGKTTIAEAVYKEIRSQFDHYYFLRDVKVGKNVVCMQKELLSGILKENDRVDTVYDGYKIMERLSKKKVLFVVDDVDNQHLIDTLLGPVTSFGGGSRIIVTTRDSTVLNGFDEIYEAELLSKGDADTLFRQYAFKSNKPSEKHDHLSRRALEYAQRLPLALIVLGAFLDKRSASEWEDELEKLKKLPNSGIQNVLRTSFDRLDNFEKNIFLDIACFFRGMGQELVTKVLDSCGFHAHIGLKVLVERALITISNSGKVEMHDLLQEIGRGIESTKELGKRSRFWSSTDVERLLTQNTATEAVEGLMNELPSSKPMYFEAEAFDRMMNLRLLIFTSNTNMYEFDHGKFHVNGDLKRLSHELRLLVWHRCPLKFLPFNFNPKNIVELDMRSSHLERLWQGIKPVKKLIFIDLRCCKYFKTIPDLTEATKLEKLDLEGCISLKEVHPSIAGLPNLVFLSFEGCTELKLLPSSIHLKSLKFLNLRACSKLEIFPEILKDMEALSELKLDETAIKELPSSIERLRRLELLSMNYCTSLVCLPDSICDLAKLRFLDVTGCEKLQNLPKNFGRLESLLELEVNYSGLEQLPVSILRLKLGRLSFYGCKQMEAPLSSWLSSSFKGRCTAVVNLDFTECNLLKLSDAIDYFSSLKILKLSRTNLESLPASMNRLDCLEQLELEGCKRLKSIPELSSSISYINAHDCTALETVSTPKSPYYMGRCFKFSNCSQLQHDLSKDIVETHFPPQGDYSRPFYSSFPGSEIPERFIHQCKGSSVTAQLPPNLFDKKFLGFAICAVTNKPKAVSYSELSARCLCTFKGNHCEYSFNFYLFHAVFSSLKFKSLWLESNHMFLGYIPWSEFGINGEEVNERCYTEAKFEIQLLFNELFKEDLRAKFDPSIKRCAPCIERCGVRFFFANNEQVAHQEFGEPVVHSEGCSAEPSDSDTTSDTSHEEQYLKLLSKLFGNEILSSPRGSLISPPSNLSPQFRNGGPRFLALSPNLIPHPKSVNNLGPPFLNELLRLLDDERIRIQLFECEIQRWSAELSCSATTTDTADKDEQYVKLSELVDKPNINSRDMYGDISDESDCEIEDNDSSGKRKIVSRWKQKVRVTSGLMQGDLDDGFSWNGSGRRIAEQGTGYERSNYNCIHRPSCRALGKLRISVNDPTIRKIKYIGRHTCWKTLPMLTHQVRVTPDMGLEAEGPSDGFSWGEYGQMNLPGDKHPRVCYVCTPRNVQGCMAIKEVQRSNDDPTILKITYRGRHTCIQAYTISIGGRGDGRISEGGGANSQDMEHFQDVNHMANNDVAGYPNHVGEVTEGTSDAVVNQLEEENPMDYEEALDFKQGEMDSDDDQPNESHSISNKNP